MKDLSPISPFSECAQIETEKAKAKAEASHKKRGARREGSRHRRGTQVADCFQGPLITY